MSISDTSKTGPAGSGGHGGKTMAAHASDRLKPDLCIIGAGAAGLSVAAGAAQMGADVVLIEKHIRDGVMGGECLHTGCVPSKALLAAGKAAKTMTHAYRFGIGSQTPIIDFAKVNDHVKGVIQSIGPIDSVERFEDFGVTVLEGKARFLDKTRLSVDGLEIAAKRFVLATGSVPAVPPVPGLDTVPYLTNETIFDNREQPRHLIIIGGGPIGMEMAQAHARLGAKVTVLERDRALPRDDAALTKLVLDAVREDGVAIEEDAQIDGVSGEAGRITVDYRRAGQAITIEGTHLLVAAGRQPMVEGLNLEGAGIRFSKRGIDVDARLRTSNRRVFAIGDCIADGQQFTHVAGYHASIVVRNALFRVPAKSDLSQVPHVTYTEPELAHVGLTEEDARARHDDTVVTEWQFAENDRAQAERETAGFIKVMARKNGRILGVSIVGPQAGEVLQPWLLALSKKMKMSDMTGYIAPYPTLGEVSKRAAGQFYTPVLFGPRVRAIVRLLLKLP